jgi:hypothetical protein
VAVVAVGAALVAVWAAVAVGAVVALLAVGAAVALLAVGAALVAVGAALVAVWAGLVAAVVAVGAALVAVVAGLVAAVVAVGAALVAVVAGLVALVALPAAEEPRPDADGAVAPKAFAAPRPHVTARQMQTPSRQKSRDGERVWLELISVQPLRLRRMVPSRYLSCPVNALQPACVRSVGSQTENLANPPKLSES